MSSILGQFNELVGLRARDGDEARAMSDVYMLRQGEVNALAARLAAAEARVERLEGALRDADAALGVAMEQSPFTGVWARVGDARLRLRAALDASDVSQ